MNRREKLITAKNAMANVVRGSAAAVMAVFLPPFLTRLMSPDMFGAWSLVLQISSYVGYLDFGIQTTVCRFIAHANELGDGEHRDRIVSTSLVALGAAGLVGLAGILVIAIVLPRLFHQMPPFLVKDTRMALVLVASSLAVGLPASVFNGIFLGLQRYEVPAAIIGGSRLLSAILLIIVARRGGSLAAMGAVMAAVNLASYGLQYLMYRKMAPMIRVSSRLVSRETARQILDYCISLSIWSFAMLLVTGLDVLIVGYFQFGAVAYYAVAATGITFLAGLLNAVFAVMIPSSAVQHARGQSRELGGTMLTATRYGSFLLLVTGLPLVLAAKGILSVWVGPSYALHGAVILQVLVAANMIRLSALPYTMSLIGTGQQRLVSISPIVEGVSNLLASIFAGYLLGAVGVALGTLLGSVIALSANLLYNMPRTAAIEFRVSDYLRDGFLRPIVCALPLIFCTVVLRRDPAITLMVRYASCVMAVIATVLLVWRWGLVGPEREKLRLWSFVPEV